MIQCHVKVTTFIYGQPVPTLSGAPATFEGSELRMADPEDPIAALYAPDGAVVTLGMEERVGGPRDTYSSISVRVELSLPCAPNKLAMRKTLRALHVEAQRALNHYVEPAQALLAQHVGEG
jgi:hypothetical protein